MDGDVVVARCSREVGAVLCGEPAAAYRALDGTRYEEATKFAFVCQADLSVPVTEFAAVPGRPTDYQWV